MLSREAMGRMVILQLWMLSSLLFGARNLPGQPVESSLLAENAALFYGSSVALDGKRAVVGSRCKAHIFEQSNAEWVETATLPNETPCFERDSGGFSEFGSSVSLDDDWLAVGAPGTPVTVPGAVYLYQWDGLQWVQSAHLVAPDSARGDLFGFSVSLEEDRLVVGAPESHIDARRGAVYVFERDGSAWLEVAKLTPDPSSPAHFGSRVSLNGDRFVVAGVDTVHFNGVAYVFEGEGAQWNKVGELVASDGGFADAFGRSVSVDGDRIVVGAPGLDPPERPSAAYVFEPVESEWVETAKLTLDDPAVHFFGSSVVVKGETLVVGRRSTCFVHGAVYLYTWDGEGWMEVDQLGPSMPAPGQGFGASTDFDGEQVIAGAPGTDSCGGLVFGAAYVYKGFVEATALEQATEGVPAGYALHANYPNPFHSTTTIAFDIPTPGHATLTVYDALGRVVQTLESGFFVPGRYETRWDASGFPGGLYLCRLQADSYLYARRLILLK